MQAYELTNGTWLCQNSDGSMMQDHLLPAAILSGSFNPLHHGHRELAEVASRLRSLPVSFELSIANVDKPELPDDEVQRRLRQFIGVARVYVTRAPTFVQKASLFPGSVFVV